MEQRCIQFRGGGHTKPRRGNMNMPNAKNKGKFQPKWHLTVSKTGSTVYLTTRLPMKYVKKLRKWSHLLMKEGKIKANSKYDASRYAMMAGIELIDQMYMNKYGDIGDEIDEGVSDDA